MYELVKDEIRINVRTRPDIKRDLEITARLRGVNVSALVNQLVMQAIREERQREPRAFGILPAQVQEIENEVLFSRVESDGTIKGNAEPKVVKKRKAK